MVKIQDLRSITPRTNGTRKESAIKHIARHHSATSDGDWSTFWPYWNKSKGWGTGGYAEIILRDGTVQLCYDPNEITNGVANHNSTTYHICVVGDGSFTDAQERAWEERCLYNLKRFGLTPDKVKGHREFSGTSTACPGIDMGMVRNRLIFLQTKVSKPVVEPVKPSEVKGVMKQEEKEEEITLSNLLKFSTNEGKNAILRVLKRFEKKDPALGKVWREKLENGTFTQDDSHEVMWVAVDRGYITGKTE